MRTSELVEEARRNVLSGTSRAVTFGCTLVLLALLGGLAELATTRSILSDARRFEASGGSIWVLTATGSVSGSACEQLNSLPAVTAGARRDGGQLVATGDPGEPIPLSATTRSFGRIFGARAVTSGVGVSAAVATRFGLPAAGGALWTSRGRISVTTTFGYPPGAQNSTLAYSAIDVVPENGAFDQCWLRSWPSSAAAVSLLRSVVVDSPGAAPPELAQLGGSEGESFDGHHLFATRLTRFAAAGCALLATLLGLLSVWLRRVELAAGRALGLTSRAVVLITLLECSVPALMTALVAFVVAAVAAVAAVAGTSDGAATVHLLTEVGALPGVAAALGFVLGATAGSLRSSPADYYRYFRDR